jgi:hypothetical protein
MTLRCGMQATPSYAPFMLLRTMERGLNDVTLYGPNCETR